MDHGRTRRVDGPRPGGAKAKNATADRVVARMRRAYFAHAAERATRYQVTFDRVLVHLWRSRGQTARSPLRTVAHVDDLVHAVACVDNVERAWSDLAEQNEAALMRVVRRQLGEMETIVFVRKLLTELRQQRADLTDRRLPTLAGYRGTQPLRVWLVDRALGRLGRAMVLQAAQVQHRRHDAADLGTGISLHGSRPPAIVADFACQPADAHADQPTDALASPPSSLRTAGPMTVGPVA